MQGTMPRGKGGPCYSVFTIRVGAYDSGGELGMRCWSL